MATLTKEKTKLSSEVLDNKEVLTGVYEDECTLLAEALNGSMRTSFDFEMIDDDIYSEERDENGVLRRRNLRKMYEQGAEYAKKRAADDPRVFFELEREKKHLEELDIMKKMAIGEAPNTMIVVSPFPDSLANEYEEDIQGYKPKLRRSMLRIITADEEGVIAVATRSLDNTNKETLLAIYDEMDWPIDRSIDSEQMLGERMHLELPKEERNIIENKLVGAFDAKLKEQKGGEWRAGRRQSEERGDSWQFILGQDDVLEKHFDAAVPILRRLKKYNQPQDEERLNAVRFMTMATMRDRYEGKVIDVGGGVEGEMSAAAHSAADKGEEFGGCGLTVTMQNEDIMQKMGYRAEDALKCVTCPLCSATVDAIRTSGGIKCPSCNKEALNSGKIIDHNNSDAANNYSSKANKTIWDYLRSDQKVNHGYIVKEELGIGGSETTIEDKSGNTIAKGKEAQRLKRSL